MADGSAKDIFDPIEERPVFTVRFSCAWLDLVVAHRFSEFFEERVLLF
ncbi:MAG: hypothetical protein MK358_02690 [Vicinamibacterales bacterium]|nr:hypothetical protein [Vicinamibacterales bacterium]